MRTLLAALIELLHSGMKRIRDPWSGSKRLPLTRLLLFATDGVPTLPIGRGTVSDRGDVEAAMQAAREAREHGIVIDTYVPGLARSPSRESRSRSHGSRVDGTRRSSSQKL